MTRVLFVDDEPKLLEGLQRMLRPHRKLWDMRFAGGGEEALALMEQNPVDIVVTDMRMPGMDGAALLQHVHDRHPGSMRIILSGQFEVEAGLRGAAVAHQFLSKPCDPEKLTATIERCSRASAALADPGTLKIVNAIGALPTAPDVYARLERALADPCVSLNTVTQIVYQDVAISAKILQLVNSAFFGVPSEIRDLHAGICFLGLDLIQRLVMPLAMMTSFAPRQIEGFQLEVLERHSYRAARIACFLAVDMKDQGVAVTAALLHDIGKLVFATRLPDRCQLAVQYSRENHVAMRESERVVFGMTHCEIGGYLLSLWGLPDVVVEAVTHHERPLHASPGSLDVTGVVHLADALASELDIPEGDLPAIPEELDPEYLERTGFASRIPEWRRQARLIML